MEEAGALLDGYAKYTDLSCVVCSEPRTPALCPLRAAPGNGTTTCTNGAAFGSQCTLGCRRGYALQGPTSVTCLHTGAWNITTPTTCAKVDVKSGDVYVKWGATSCSSASDEGFDPEVLTVRRRGCRLAPSVTQCLTFRT